MNSYEHLQLIQYQGETQRQTKRVVVGYKMPEDRQKSDYSQNTTKKVEQVISSYTSLKNKFSGLVKSSLIFELEVNQSVDFMAIEKQLISMGIQVLASVENKKGFWVVFSDDETLAKFKQKLAAYGSPEGPKYDFFNAFGELRDIPKDDKIGVNLKKKPLTESADFIDIELWRLRDEQKIISFTEQLKQTFSDQSKFRITDKLITKSFALLRVKIAKSVFDEVIDLKEIVRAERPSAPQFNSFDVKNIDVSEITTNPPNENAAGILIVDSGILSNHPFLEKCVGDEQNFQIGETETQDTVGHGTAVAGCVAYGDIEKSLNEKELNPSNWIFSAKVMYAETDFDGNKKAVYDPEKLVEHQLKEAIEYFISNSDNQIRVVNISLGNSDEIWHKTYTRQLPLAALVDELAYSFPNVVFIVSTGNQHPQNVYTSIAEIKDHYPQYLVENEDYKIINPATAALALTIGSIAQPVRVQNERFGNESIKTPIAVENQPSPFTRSGPGINGMVKPELVEYGGNLILYNNNGRISEDVGGKILVLNNQVTDNIVNFDYGTSFSAPKIAHIAGQIANKYPQRSANFIKNLLLQGAFYPSVAKNETNLFSQSINYPEMPSDDFNYLAVCGYGLPTFERAVNSFDNRVVLFDESKIQLNKVKVYSLQLPEIFFTEKGRKRISVALSFTPQTRPTRGDSYLSNRMEFHLFHSKNPQELVEKYAIADDTNTEEVPAGIEKFEIKFPGANSRNSGCHQKAWKEFKREPKNRPSSPVSLVLINRNKWIADENAQTDYCLSVTFEHEKEIDLYTQLRANIQTRARVL
jgi:hypothetical protein